MIRIIIIISIFIPTLLFGQSDSQLEISSTAEKISGRWILVKYEKDSLSREWRYNEENYFVKTFINNILIEEIKIDGFYLRVMLFKSAGQGNYEDYFDYKSKSETNKDYGIEEVNEIPELVFINGKVVIKTTHLFGADEITDIVKLNDHELILSKDFKTKWTYKKLD